jgi:FixJ family two-component response regulator
MAMAPSNAETIAIVDDDSSAREGMHRLLEAIGLRAESFASAAAFLAGAPERFARLILDQHMPETTGLELAHSLRSSGIHMPIMLVTGNLTPAVVLRAQGLGIEKVLEKPLRLEDVSAFCLTGPSQ